jgi:hypothetical protein
VRNSSYTTQNSFLKTSPTASNSSSNHFYRPHPQEQQLKQGHSIQVATTPPVTAMPHLKAEYDPPFPSSTHLSHPSSSGHISRDGSAYGISSSAPSRIRSPPTYGLSAGQPLNKPPLKIQAAFVGKLYAMLEDEDITRSGLIYWSADGTMFTCPNPTEFARCDVNRSG